MLCGFFGFLFEAFAEDLGPSREAIEAAVAKSLPFLETGARDSMEKRKQRFTCHNQALPVIALITARSRGITIDAEKFAAASPVHGRFSGEEPNELSGGQALTAGYALWTLEMGDWKSDETTEAVEHFT